MISAAICFFSFLLRLQDLGTSYTFRSTFFLKAVLVWNSNVNKVCNIGNLSVKAVYLNGYENCFL
jgi:hypothetical protein